MFIADGGLYSTWLQGISNDAYACVFGRRLVPYAAELDVGTGPVVVVLLGLNDMKSLLEASMKGGELGAASYSVEGVWR
jgi:hypothetical protein